MQNLDEQQSLGNIKADRRLAGLLYREKAIDREGYQAALDFLYPADKWTMWISRLLLTFGVALVLSGIVYFFAFNWAEMSKFAKFSIIQIALILSLAVGYWRGYDSVGGKIALFAAATFVGVFMAVFGQVYQTGADAYTLFLTWSLMILVWAIVARNIALWVLWWLVSNLALWLWWKQIGWQSENMEYMIFAYMALFNGALLVALEYCAKKGAEFLYPAIARCVLAFSTLFFAMASLIILIMARDVILSTILGAVIATAIHGGIVAYYYFIGRDIRVMAILLLSVAICIEFFMARVLYDWLFDGLDSVTHLIMGIMTIGVFGSAVLILRKLIESPNRQEVGHG